MKRKSLIILMTLIFCLSCFSGITTSAFSDVTEEHRHQNAIIHLTEKGVIHGYEDGSFKPENEITRAEFLTLLMEFTGMSNVYGTSYVETGFADVDVGIHTAYDDAGKPYTINNENQYWAAGYIKMAADKKIVSGYGNGLFKPDANVTYEEAIKMVVCALGREGMAQTKVDTLGIPFWPDAYLSVGYDLNIVRDTDFVKGNKATRSNIAQMLYNVKDVSVILAPNINPGSIGGVGGVGGGSVGGNSNNSSGISTKPVSNIEIKGQVVAAFKRAAEKKWYKIILDENIEIDGEPLTELTKNYIIVKLDYPSDGNNYIKLYTNGEDFSSKLGKHVKVTYTFNPDSAVGGRNEIQNVLDHNTETISISSSDIKREDTIEKNNRQTEETYICYTDGEEDYDLPLYTTDLDTLKVIYNNEIIDVEAERDAYLEANPTYQGEREDIDIITLSVLMPLDGEVTFIDANEDRSMDLIWVKSYETYVVGSRNDDTKIITDKFRKDPVTNQAVTLDLSSSDVLVTSGGEEKEFKKIANSSIVTVLKTFDGEVVEARYEEIKYKKDSSVTVRTENGKRVFVVGGKKYPITDYYLDHVDSTIEFEYGDTVTLYHNSKNEVFWVAVAQPSYLTGYLIRARILDEMTGKLSLDILTTSGTVTTFTMADSGTRYITKADNCITTYNETVGEELRIYPDSTTNANGNLYKNLSEDKIHESLLENAATINEGKPATITGHAETSQPVMYIATTGNKLTSLVTVEVDPVFKHTTESKKYKKSNTGTFDFKEADGDTFSAVATSTFIFVPNDRTNYMTGNGYKIGQPNSTAIKNKLTEYMRYNIEPYYAADANGGIARRIFVVYNQNIDATPNYRSENMVVSMVESTLEGTKVTGYVDSNTATKTYTFYNESYITNVPVLNENFVRGSVCATVDVGDIIRVGWSPINDPMNVEIIFDASTASTEKKSCAVAIDSTTLPTEEPSEFLVYYYARVGEITAIEQSITPEFCKFKINGDRVSTFHIGPTYKDTQILFYDLTESALNNKPKIAKMGDLVEGDVLFVKQGKDLVNEQIYAVRPAATPVVTP